VSYDEKLAGRVRRLMAERKGVAERKMFGGLAFMVGDHMCCGIIEDDLMVRVGPDRYAEALARPHARPMDFTGRPLSGYVYVAPAGYKSERSLSKWVDWGATFVASLPPKKRGAQKKSSRRKLSRRG
jgi:TfoX/Sxy family transcriptional regulator of competence genes